MQQIMLLIIISVFVSLSLFYYLNQKISISNDEKRKQRNDKQHEYLDSLLKTKEQSPVECERSVTEKNK